MIINIILILLTIGCAVLLCSENFLPGGSLAIAGIILSFITTILAFFHHPIKGVILLILLFTVWLSVLIITYRQNSKKDISSEEKLELDSNLDIDAIVYGKINNIKINDIGIAISIIRPHGIAEFNNVRHSVISSGQIIQPQSKILVTAIDGGHIYVKEI